MTHKIAIKNQEREENPKKNLAFKIIHYNDNDDDKDVKIIMKTLKSTLCNFEIS